MLNLEQCTVSEPVKRMLDTMFVQKRVPQALIIEGDHTKTTELHAYLLPDWFVGRKTINRAERAAVVSKHVPVLTLIFIWQKAA